MKAVSQSPTRDVKTDLYDSQSGKVVRAGPAGTRSCPATPITCPAIDQRPRCGGNPGSAIHAEVDATGDLIRSDAVSMREATVKSRRGYSVGPALKTAA